MPFFGEETDRCIVCDAQGAKLNANAQNRDPARSLDNSMDALASLKKQK